MSSANPKTLVAILTFNEGEKLQKVLNSVPETSLYDVLVVNDGSTDNTIEIVQNSPKPKQVISHPANSGVGAGIKTAAAYAREHKYKILVIMAGNGKMLPGEIERLLKPIHEGQADYVQGSRYLKGGTSENLPLFRTITIKLFTFFTNIILGFKGTDITCGFRAYKTDILNDPDININQDWLRQYEMEYYLHYKVIRKGYRVIEAPVSMIYPREGSDYTKIKPVIGWWSMLRPWIFLILKIKK